MNTSGTGEDVNSATPSSEQPPEMVPARMVNEFVYCPRLFYLEWVQGEWAESVDTLEGEHVHRRVDTEVGRLPPPDEMARDDQVAARAVLLSAPRARLVARMDLLEGSDGAVRPVDYKKGAPGPTGPWDPERVQLCVQGLILRENGYRCDEGVVYYAETKQRFIVHFDDALIARTLEAVRELERVAAAPLPPPPLIDSPKCPRCSLVGICLPDEVQLLRGAPIGEVRRLVPARDDAQPVYVVEQGAAVGKSGERIVVRRRDGEEVSVRLLDISQLSLYGNVQLSAQALRALAEREIPIFHHSYGGWLAAVTTGVPSRNVELRMQQYRVADDEERALPIARAIVVGKLRNQRTLLRRNHPGQIARILVEIARYARLAQEAASMDRLFGLEGMAARAYFAGFAGMLRDPLGFDVAGRDRRPPPDPVNATLSFLYSLLMKDVLRALIAVGLDPYRGVYHRLRTARPSLALDLMEEFRPLIADSVCLSLFNNRVLDRSAFIVRGPGCNLRDGPRRDVIRAFESRMETLVRHPLFRYRVSYRRLLEMQARLMARTIAGEVPEYRSFTTR
ncbi:MAG TPA: CRISPR-associated endonuclease Cas1 [Acidimicrobiales bacterium]|nr:CRISPR-associated endonuclease Cas1 [Acidimicrobiales bacterium]